jgi:hypothetical protein
MQYDWAWFLATIIGILVIALPLMLAVAMVIYAERKIWAAMALRRGPNVVGPWGLLQSFADGLKVFLKETIIPTSASVKVMIGASRNRPRLAAEGTIVSLRKTFSPSAKLCSRPQGPTTLGPRRIWTAAHTLRSA